MGSIELRTTPIETMVAFDQFATPQTVITMGNYANDAPKLTIKNLDTNCRSFSPGHRVHFIQLKLGIGKPLKRLTLLRVEVPNKVIVSMEDDEKDFYNHNIQEFQAILDYFKKPVPGWLHEAHIVELQGYIFSVFENMNKMSSCINSKL